MDPEVALLPAEKGRADQAVITESIPRADNHAMDVVTAEQTARHPRRIAGWWSC